MGTKMKTELSKRTLPLYASLEAYLVKEGGNLAKKPGMKETCEYMKKCYNKDQPEQVAKILAVFGNPTCIQAMIPVDELTGGEQGKMMAPMMAMMGIDVTKIPLYVGTIVGLALQGVDLQRMISLEETMKIAACGSPPAEGVAAVYNVEEIKKTYASAAAAYVKETA